MSLIEASSSVPRIGQIPMVRLLISVTLFIALSPILAAGTIIKSTGAAVAPPQFGFSGGLFQTIDDGNNATLGDVDVGLNYTGELDAVLTDLGSGASLTIANVLADGPVLQPLPGLVVQSTIGGEFALFDEANALLLAGQFDAGLFTGVIGQPTGSFRTITPLTFTAGSILDDFLDSPVGNLSISLGQIRSLPAGSQGPGISGGLNPFDATLTAQLDGSVLSVPEPASIVMMGGLLVSAGATFRGRRRSMRRA